ETVECLLCTLFVVGDGGCWRCSFFFFFSSRRRHTRLVSDWSSDVCSSDLARAGGGAGVLRVAREARLSDAEEGRLMAAPLLVELLTEELPPKALRQLGYAFADALVSDLRKDGFAPADGEFVVFATPRRLGVLIPAVAPK